MAASPETIDQLARDATRHADPDEALQALTALRRELDELEPGLVVRALRAGSSWSRIASALGVSKQAAHRKHRDALAQSEIESDGKGDGEGDHGEERAAKILVTAEARRCVQFARQEARGLGQLAVGTEHLLLGILRCRRSAPVNALRELGVTLERARAELQPTIVEGGGGEFERRSNTPQFRRRKDITPHTQRILEGAVREAIRLRDGHIGVEHLLLALLSDQENGAVQTLHALRCTPAQIRGQLDRAWRELAAGPADSVSSTPSRSLPAAPKVAVRHQGPASPTRSRALPVAPKVAARR